MTAFYCTAILLFLFFFQIPISALLVRARLAISESTDRRINLVNKLILGIQTIKSYAWEEPILQNIEESRKTECRRYL